MKKNLFRIVGLVFILATILNLTTSQPTYADAASDKQAVSIIAACKDFVGPVVRGSDCDKYRIIVACKDFVGPVVPGSDCERYRRTCATSGGGDALCQSIKRLNSVVPSLIRQGILQKCTAAGKRAADCTSAWASCIYNHIKNDTLSGTDAQKCSDLVAQGKLDEAIKPVAPDENKSSCAVIGVGWIICPIVTFMAQIVDGAYGFVSSLLTVQPLFTTGQTAGVYTAWSVMRNFANVAFIIAFLVIIFSQLTSVGISNYGIKNLLKRVVVSAALVNVSYWLCAAAIDGSNILGVSINQVLQDVKEGLILPNAADFGATGAGWTGIAGGILAGTIAGVALYAALSALLPALVAALLTIVTVFLVLTLRQALIILLVVISPLAFTAYLLPNTEGLFKKWRKLGQTLLVMYPLFSLLFGSSALASTIVMGSASGPYKFFIQLMGATISIIPLVVAPTLLKATTGILGQFVGFINNPNKGPFDAMKKGAEGVGKRLEGRREIRSLNGNVLSRVASFGRYRRRAKKSAITSGVENEAKRAQSKYVAGEAVEDEAFRNRLAGGRTLGPNADAEALNRALAGAVSVQAKIEADEVTAASAVIKQLNLDRNLPALRALSTGGKVGGLDGGSSLAVRAAAMKGLVDSHDVKGVNKLLDSVGSMDQKTRESFADSLGSSSERPQYVGQAALTAIRQHGNTDDTGALIQAQSSTALAVAAIKNNAYSAEKIATGDKDELEYIHRVATTASTQADNIGIKANAVQARTDPRFSGRIGKNKGAVDDLAGLP